jgi:hypothetical protein
MATFPGIPPWLNINPAAYIDAAKSGASVGLQIAAAQNRANELQTATDERAWEFQQELRRKATEAIAEREKAAEQLAALEKYRMASLAEQNRWHTGSLAAKAADTAARLRDYDRQRMAALEPKPHFTPGGGLLLYDPATKTVKTVREPSPTDKSFSPTELRGQISDPMRQGVYRMLPPGTKEREAALYVKQLEQEARRLGIPDVAPAAVPPPGAGAVIPPAASRPGMDAEYIKKLREAARKKIKENPLLEGPVKVQFKQISGMDL